MKTASAALLALLALVTGLAVGTAGQAPERVDFARDVQPLLRANCYGCHGPLQQYGNFRLDRRRDSLPNRVGANGARIVPGKSGESRLYLRVSGSEAGLQMPPTGALGPGEIATIKAWIDQGADWPDALAGETPSPPQDPVAAQIVEALRRGDRRGFERLLAANPKAARVSASGGTTPLMHAALYRNVAAVRRLLDGGADPNARDDAGATALLWAVDDAETTRLLLEHGADANAQSEDRQTPLLLAARRYGSRDVVKLLLDHGAKVEGQPVLAAAAGAGDASVMRLLLEHGAESTVLPNDLAMRSGCDDCMDLLLRTAPRPALTRALVAAARFGRTADVQRLLDRGAEPTGDALQAAAVSDKVPVAIVSALLERGARDDSALGLAMRLGDTPVVAALRAAGSTGSPPPALDVRPSGAPRSVRGAVEASLPLLQRSDVGFLKGAGCISCHNNSLFQMTTAAARARGFRVDEASVASQTALMGAYIESWRERVLQDIPIPGGVDTIGYILLGLQAAQYPPDAATDALARFLRRRQAADGGWRIAAQRQPIESSDFSATAVSLKALQAFAPAPLEADYRNAIERGASWLARAQPSGTEDHVFQVLGLAWAHADRTAVRNAARGVAALQRDDGGWSQIPTLASDAYATGQALTALAEAGTPANDPAYQRGVRFLLGTQLEDGSWHVRTHTLPIQPYFESGYPHGRDQFISSAAANWATMALARTVR